MSETTEIKPPKNFKFTRGELIYNNGEIQIVKYAKNTPEKNSGMDMTNDFKDYGKIGDNGIAIYPTHVSWCVVPYWEHDYENVPQFAQFYLNRSDLFMFFIDGAPAFLLSSSGEFRNNNGRSINEEEIESIAGAIRFLFDSEQIKPKGSGKSGLFKATMKLLLNSDYALTSAAMFYNYCHRVKKKRWKEHEYKMLKTNGKFALEYAMCVAQGRVPEIEGAIAGNKTALFSYLHYLDRQRIAVPVDIIEIRSLYQRNYGMSSPEIREKQKAVKENRKAMAKK